MNTACTIQWWAFYVSVNVAEYGNRESKYICEAKWCKEYCMISCARSSEETGKVAVGILYQILFLFRWPCILANDQLNAQIFNTFIIILYMHMFRAVSCSSSGGQIVLIQHLVSSLSVSDRPVLCNGRSLTESDDTRCYINPLNAELNPICYLLALLELIIFSMLSG